MIAIDREALHTFSEQRSLLFVIRCLPAWQGQRRSIVEATLKK